METLPGFFEFKAAQKMKTYTLTLLYSMLLEEKLLSFSLLFSFGSKFFMLFHACCTTFSLWHWEGLVATVPSSSLQPLLSSLACQARLGPGSNIRCWSKPWGRQSLRCLTAACPPQQGCPELSLPCVTSCLLSTGACSTNISKTAPLPNLATSSQPLPSCFFSQDPKSSLSGLMDGSCYRASCASVRLK